MPEIAVLMPVHNAGTRSSMDGTAGSAPILSFLIPIYQMEHFLRRSLDSLFMQHRPEVEYVFVDDGSRDRSWAVLQEILHENPGPRACSILLRLPENRGVENARMEALARARGQYVWFMDADDLLARGTVDAVLELLQREDPDVLQCRCRNLFAGEEMPSLPEKLDYGTVNKEAMLRIALTCRSTLHSACLNLIKMELARNHPMVRTGLRIAEDYVMQIRWLVFAEKILEIRDPIYGYVQRPSSAMHRHDLVRRNRDVNAATNLIVKFFEEEVPAGQYCFARKELETARINLRGYLLCCIYGDYPRSEQPGIYRECAGLFQGMALRRVLLYAQSCYLPLLILDHWGAERLLPYCFSLMRRGRVWSAGIQTVIRQWLGRVRG